MNDSKSHHLVKKHHARNYFRFASNYLRSQKRRALNGRSGHSDHSFNQRSTRQHKHFPHWLPGDDYLLINSVVMTCNLTEVFHTVRFSIMYTEKDIEARWKSLLFDPIVSSTSLMAISRLPAFVKARLNRNVPFSAKEDDLIIDVNFNRVFPDGLYKHLDSTSLVNSVFSELLRKHPTVFYSGRDELDLYRQWSRLRDCNLIASPSPARLPPALAPDHSTNNTSSGGGDPESFSDTELLLQETVHSALSAGVEKLTEASTVARRRRNLSNPTYHGFQALITDSVLSALSRPVTNRADYSHSQYSSEAVQIGEYSILKGGSFVGISLHVAFQPGNLTLPGPPKTARFTNRSEGLWHRQRFVTEHRLGNAAREKRVCSLTMSYGFHLQRRLELSRRRRRLHARLRASANEAERWTQLVRQLVPEADKQLSDVQLTLPVWPPVLATLTGVSHRFLITDYKMSFGRSTTTFCPQIDLSLAGDASRVSRCHGSIRVDPDGCFWICNFSNHPVYVDGNPVLTDEEVELKDLATMTISRLSFRFDVLSAGVGGQHECAQEHSRVKPASSSPSASLRRRPGSSSGGNAPVKATDSE